jgi:hypothetical protein
VNPRRPFRPPPNECASAAIPGAKRRVEVRWTRWFGVCLPPAEGSSETDERADTRCWVATPDSNALPSSPTPSGLCTGGRRPRPTDTVPRFIEANHEALTPNECASAARTAAKPRTESAASAGYGLAQLGSWFEVNGATPTTAPPPRRSRQRRKPACASETGPTGCEAPDPDSPAARGRTGPLGHRSGNFRHITNARQRQTPAAKQGWLSAARAGSAGRPQRGSSVGPGMLT